MVVVVVGGNGGKCGIVWQRVGESGRSGREVVERAFGDPRTSKPHEKIASWCGASFVQVLPELECTP